MLWLTPPQLEAVLAHSEQSGMHEACGLIGGIERNGLFSAIEVIPIPNDAADPAHHFHMEERALARTMMGFAARGLSLVGIYHSHPVSDPIPSQEDIRSANYPGTPYLIVSRPGPNASCAVWDIHYGEVTALPLYIGEVPPTPAELPPHQPKALPFVVMFSALMAAALMLMLAFSLLPPAPLIP
ncbi:MAG: M67 family metallopeptidase [Anaerolineae bacterium]